MDAKLLFLVSKASGKLKTVSQFELHTWDSVWRWQFRLFSTSVCQFFSLTVHRSTIYAFLVRINWLSIFNPLFMMPENNYLAHIWSRQGWERGFFVEWFDELLYRSFYRRRRFDFWMSLTQNIKEEISLCGCSHRTLNLRGVDKPKTSWNRLWLSKKE